MTFDVDYALELLPLLLRAAGITILATVGGTAIAAVLGFPVAVARMSRIWVVRAAASSYIEFVRTTPLIVQLFFIFYVLPQFGIFFPALLTGILGLGLHFTAYTAEVYRAGIESVGRGQWEAAAALSLGSLQVWLKVILPQAIPPTVPVLGNYAIGMFKESALLATITIRELLGTALSYASINFRYFEPLVIVGTIYLLLSLGSTVFVKRLERALPRRFA